MMFTGVLLGSFRDHEGVVMERCCVERGNYLQALDDAKELQRITQGDDVQTWTPAVETHTAARVARSDYPHTWSVELVRNASGRAFYFVSRFTRPHECEYVEGIDGEPQCYRLKKDAERACDVAQALSAPRFIDAKGNPTDDPYGPNAPEGSNFRGC